MSALVPTCPLENPSKPSLTANILCPSEMPTLTAERTAAFMPAAGAPTFNTATLKLLWGHKKTSIKCDFDCLIITGNIERMLQLLMKLCGVNQYIWFLVCYRFHAGPTVVIITDAVRSRTLRRAPQHGVDPADSTLHWSSVWAASDGTTIPPGRVNKSCLSRGARCHLISL